MRWAAGANSRASRASSVASSSAGLKSSSSGTGAAAASVPMRALTGKTAGPEIPNGVKCTSPKDSSAGCPAGRAVSRTLRSRSPARRRQNSSRQTTGTSAGRGGTMRWPSAAAIA